MKTALPSSFKGQLRKVAWITASWAIISMIQFYQGYNALEMYGCLDRTLELGHYLRASVFTGLLAGVLGGSMVVFAWEKWLRTIAYGKTLLLMFVSFTVVYYLIGFMAGLIVHSTEVGLPIYHPKLATLVLQHMNKPGSLFSYVYWLAVVLITLIAFQVNDKYGPGVFQDFLLGRYFHPRREERIFMFLDMRASTSIAEQLGEGKYFDLVREVFADATAPITRSKGEIYQYVGDEIVVSWKMEKGLEQANCVQCFFEIRKAIQKKSAEYQNKYGLVPAFKAGLHYGHVMAGEVGVVKRDIAFSGDVLNTTSRIQGKCNEMGVDLLLSKYLLDKLSLPPQGFEPKRIGEMLLRGKQESVVLYTV